MTSSMLSMLYPEKNRWLDQVARSLKTHRQGNQGQYHIHRPMLVLEFAEVANMYIHVCKV